MCGQDSGSFIAKLNILRMIFASHTRYLAGIGIVWFSQKGEKYLSVGKQVVTKVNQLLFEPYLSLLSSFRVYSSYFRYFI